MGGTIIGGVPGTARAGDAAELAIAVAARLGLRLVLVHVSGDGEREVPAAAQDIHDVEGLRAVGTALAGG